MVLDVVGLHSAPARFACWVPQIARPLWNDDGVKPPWNQPHVMPSVFIRSPMLRPVIDAVTPPGVPSAFSGVLGFEH